MSAPAEMPGEPKEVNEVSPAMVALLWLASVAIRLWCRTLRFQVSAAAREAAAADGPMVIVLWHNRLFSVPWAVRAFLYRRPISALVSASKDGAIAATVCSLLGVRIVRGSSSRMGREALQQLIARGRAGNDIAITPDGPRGPVYFMGPGAWLVSRRLGAPMLLLGFRYGAAWRLRSWDRFYLPKPFSTVVVEAELVTAGVHGGNEGAIGALQLRMLELNGEAV